MADVSSIILPDGATYNLKDSAARSVLSSIKQIYFSVTELGFTNDPKPTLTAIAKKMSNNSIGVFNSTEVDETEMTLNLNQVNMVFIVRISINRIAAIGFRAFGSTSLASAQLFYGAYNNTAESFVGWKQLPFSDDVDLKVSKSGDSMTGGLQVRTTSLEYGTVPSSDIWGNSVNFADNNGDQFGAVSPIYRSNGSVGIQLGTRYRSGNQNTLRMFIAENGTASVLLTHPAAWRTALDAPENNDIFYSAGSYSVTTAFCYGDIASSQKVCEVCVPLPKFLSKRSQIKITTLTGCYLRTVSGAWVGSAGANLFSYLTNATQSVSSANGNIVKLTLTKNDGWGITNNTPVVGSLSMQFTLT